MKRIKEIRAQTRMHKPARGGTTHIRIQHINMVRILSEGMRNHIILNEYAPRQREIDPVHKSS